MSVADHNEPVTMSNRWTGPRGEPDVLPREAGRISDRFESGDTSVW
jgi:hypothetical protein